MAFRLHMKVTNAIVTPPTLRSGVRPEDWREWENRPVGRTPTYLDRAFVQSWTGTDSVMRQPALDHHLIVLHRGGAKRVRRLGGRTRRTVDVELNSCTTIESGSAYGWATEGPIDFVHVYVEPGRFSETVAQEFDRDPAAVGVAETIGWSDPHCARLIELLVDNQNDPDWAQVADAYIDALLVRLAASAWRSGNYPVLHPPTLTRRTVLRVRDYIRENLGERISLKDLADVAGYSRFHFIRAFRASTGLPPYSFLLTERINYAREQLEQSELPIADIARAAGFSSHAQFSTRFRELMGRTPAEHRRAARL